MADEKGKMVTTLRRVSCLLSLVGLPLPFWERILYQQLTTEVGVVGYGGRVEEGS